MKKITNWCGQECLACPVIVLQVFYIAWFIAAVVAAPILKECVL
jgi:hypothetical protein